MTDEDLILQAAGMPTFFCDGFGAYRKMNGVLRCIGYVMDGGAQLNLIISLAGAEAANQETRQTLDGKPTKGLLRFWKSPVLSH